MTEQPKRTNILNYISTIGIQFVIPVYQRNYTWDEKKEVKKLLDDFKSLINTNKNHFIGIIMYLSKVKGFDFKEHIIIDGQQRLTTFFLMLHAVRALAEEDDKENIIKQIDAKITNDGVDEKFKMKLKPLVSDDDVYSVIAAGKYKKLQSEQYKSIYGQSRVYRNFYYIKKYFRTLLDQYGYDSVLSTFIKLNLVVIPIEDSDNAQQVFESINASGVPLTATDLIRNFILMDLDSDTQDIIHEHYWKPIEMIFDNTTKMEEFFRHYLATKKFSLCNKKDIYREFKDYWYDKTNSIEEKLTDIYNYADNFGKLYLYNHITNEEILEFRELNIFTPTSFLIEVLELERNNNIDEKTTIEIINLITVYFIRRDLAGADSNTISRLFPTLLKRVLKYCDGEYNDILEVTKMFLINYNINNKSNMPDDLSIKNYMKNVNAYAKPNIEMILNKIENYNNKIPYDKNALSKEHIMPQTPNKYWKDVTNNISEEEYSYYVNLLGNLTIVSSKDNSSMGNKDFETKKEYLSKTKHIKMNEYILNQKVWNIESIENRTNELINMINIVYPYTKSKLKLSKRMDIYFSKSGIDAWGYINEDFSVKIEAGSKIKIKRGSENVLDDLFSNLYASNIIDENENQFCFIKDYTFKNIQEATSIIYPQIEEPEKVWKDAFGVTIKEGIFKFK